MASKNEDLLKIEGTDIPKNAAHGVSDTPLIFRCMSCGTIVGDSTDWITANEKLRSITLLRVTSKVQCGRPLLSSANGEDMGSAYHILSCQQCKADFGKMYKTTPPHLDDCRNRFTFDIDKIDSYQVGRADQELNDVGDDLLTVPKALTISSKMDKIQQTLTALEGRVSALENSRQSKTSNKADPDVADSNVTDMPGSGTSSKNGSALDASRTDLGSLKRRSQAAGLYASASPTLKRNKVHK